MTYLPTNITSVSEFLLRHPLIRTFHLDYGSEEQSFIPITPPIDVLSSLEKLVFTFASWQELEFQKHSSDSTTLFLPRLRFLELHSSNMNRDWTRFGGRIVELFTQLKEQGTLEAFELFSIYDEGTLRRTKLSEHPLCELLSPEKIFVASHCPSVHRYV